MGFSTRSWFEIVCGHLLKLVLFAPSKPRVELVRDLILVVLIQFAALGSGLWSVWQARPLFLVAEVDRFKVIGLPDFPNGALDVLLPELQPKHGLRCWTTRAGWSAS